MHQPELTSNGSGAIKTPAKVGHVNLMVDTVIANIDADGLRAIVRSIMALDPPFSSVFTQQALLYLEKTKPTKVSPLFILKTSTSRSEPTAAFESYRRRARCLMGCGRGFDSLELLTEIVRQATDLPCEDLGDEEELGDLLATVDGDIVQALTTVTEEMRISGGARQMTATEAAIQLGLQNALKACQTKAGECGIEFCFERCLICIESQFGAIGK